LYSVANRRSYEHIETRWVPEEQHHCPGVCHILVGAKRDLRTRYEKGELSSEEVREFGGRPCPIYDTEGNVIIEEVVEEPDFVSFAEGVEMAKRYVGVGVVLSCSRVDVFVLVFFGISYGTVSARLRLLNVARYKGSD
jgi:GTPase SAR1 family protein